jgi:cell division protein FtsI (penicillin-binding protein 3)
MPTRSDDPRRASRRGTAGEPVVPQVAAGTRGGLADARRYTPRGRTLRERSDPFRPALRVVEGGRREQSRHVGRSATGGAADATPAGKGTADRAAGNGSRAARSTRATTAGARTTPSSTARRGATGGATAPRGATGGATRRGGPTGAAIPRRGATGGRARAAGGGPPRRAARRRLKPPRPADAGRRLRVATALALTIFAIIAGRLVMIQLTQAPAYAAKGLALRLQEEIVAAPRGKIYDRTGAILAHSVEARYVYADPTRVQDIEATADALAPLLGRLGIARSEIVAKLQRQNRADGTEVQFRYLARGVDIDTGEQIRLLNLAGVAVRRDERRVVPGNDLAATLIGFTGRDLNGLEGLEARYDDVLRGVDGRRVFEVGDGKLNREIPGGYRKEQPAHPGRSLQLTIDRYLQFEVQQILGNRMREVNATFGAAVVLDVRTGEVLAQASYPGYDAANPFAVPARQWVDTPSALVVDPGSVHKAIVLGAALQEGVVRPDTVIPVGPSITKGDTVFRDTHPHARETPMTLAGVMAYSSNVGVIRIADRLGAGKLYEYQQRFGLGRPTGEGLPAEAPGLVQPPKNWSGSSYGSIPIGNGVAVTPLQMAAAYAAIANDGRWVQPHLLLGTIGPDGTVEPAPAPATRQVMDPVPAADLRHILEAVVVVKGATGIRAAIPGYRVAGKTGTGLRVVDGKYTDGQVASFVGMAPADAPRYVVAVFAHAANATGGAVAGPAFRDMMALTLGRFKVPPTGTPPPSFTVYP